MTCAAVLVNCSPSIQRRAKRSMPTGSLQPPGPGLAPMVKADCEDIKSHPRAVLRISRLSRCSGLGLRRPAFVGRFRANGRSLRQREARHAIAMHGTPALPADFTDMPYANPDAPKGGRLVQGILGTFDSLNPFIVRGLAVQQISGFVLESLMARGNDEAFTLYGCSQECIETDAKQLRHLSSRSRGELLRRQAGARRGRAVLLALAARQGRPNHRQYYAKVAKAEAPTLSPCGSISAAPTTANCR